MNKAYLLIGGNIGDRLANIKEAIQLLNEAAGTIVQSSAIYETAPWGNTQQAPFLNQALFISTSHNATELLNILLAIEVKMGRIRSIPLGPRIMDIDIIYFNNEIIETAQLSIPHPQLHKRNFVLIPLVEIVPNYIHPILNKTNSVLLSECNDESLVHKKINF
ncbi:MAG: 2-amino-4-hydroxy-6-hydroxymethyldihydropteridine diphosphokinase [Bacteroidetes bacterium]|nr:2-amino-4-hydroxy-6-hydroxymethyldihydropteridine diphosphokinase [Bacteroidota bacterium]